jgi:hypothetical protein
VRAVQHNIGRWGAALIAACAMFGSIGIAQAETTPYTFGEPVDVVLTAPVSSEIAHVGDQFFFKTISEVKLGDLDVPAGTPGWGRIALAKPSQRGSYGALAMQADVLDLGAQKVYINVDPTIRPRAHFSNSGDMVLPSGAAFRVKTIYPRDEDAPLVRMTKLPPGTVVVR